MVELGITFLDEDGYVQGLLRIQGSELSFHGPLQGDTNLCCILPSVGHETAYNGEKFRGSFQIGKTQGVSDGPGSLVLISCWPAQRLLGPIRFDPRDGSLQPVL